MAKPQKRLIIIQLLRRITQKKKKKKIITQITCADMEQGLEMLFHKKINRSNIYGWNSFWVKRKWVEIGICVYMCTEH